MALKRAIPTKGLRPETMLYVQDRAVQSQALLNVKDSNKVWLGDLLIWDFYGAYNYAYLFGA